MIEKIASNAGYTDEGRIPRIGHYLYLPIMIVITIARK